MLRTLPENAHASLERRLADTLSAQPLVNGKQLSSGTVEELHIDGLFSVKSAHSEGVISKRTIFPSVLGPAIVDRIQLTNVGDKTLEVVVPSWKRYEVTEADQGLYGSYIIDEFVTGEGRFKVAKGETIDYAIVRTARKLADAPYFGHLVAEFEARRAFVDHTANNLIDLSVL